MITSAIGRLYPGMKPTTPKKLALSTHTLKRLADQDLSKVVGGLSYTLQDVTKYCTGSVCWTNCR